MSEISLIEAMSNRRTRREFQRRAVPAELVYGLLWAAQGVTDESGKRTVPSAHALHPLRLIVSAGAIEGYQPGLYSVASPANTMALMVARDVRSQLQSAALEDQPWIGAAAGIITVCADLVAPSRDFADQPPFGARGLRYVYIEAGAAAQNIHLRAAAEGLACVLVAGFRDEATAAVLDLSAPVAPILHVCFGWPPND